MQLEDLDYDLPDELIAQRPLPERESARLLVLAEPLHHKRVRDLPELLPPSLFVVNDTRVLNARLHGHKSTGAKVELLLVERLSAPGVSERWRALSRTSKPLREGTSIELGPLGALVVAKLDGAVEVQITSVDGASEIGAVLERVGHVPLPPYIKRDDELSDRARYQTVFAAHPGAVAAPTAGLHFSDALMQRMRGAGHEFAQVTLHVGPGTFRPVSAPSLDQHRMHTERYHVPQDTVTHIKRAKREQRPVVAVGTTVVRTLEATAVQHGTLTAGEGSTDIFIRPGYSFSVVDALMTNFHLPRSTLLALVMAFAGVDVTLAAYEEAVRARYRFFSYGDAMLIPRRA